jgi:hypothetical protein
MIRACAVVAVLLFSGPAYAIPCWAVRKAVAQYGETAVEAWARARGIPDKEIEKARRCLRQVSAPETMVQAVPDRIAVLDSLRSPMGRHDFHIAAIRRIRCDRIWGILSPAA